MALSSAASYDEYVCDRARNEDDISINNSVQSIIILVTV